MAKKLAKFDSSKHPRGSKGRFVETPDEPKTVKKTLLKATVYQTEDGKRKLKITGLSLKQKKKLLAEFVAAEARIKAERLKQEAEAKAKAEAVASVVAKAVDKVVAKTLAEAKAKTKRPKLTPEEKAAKEASKAEQKEAKEAEKQRKAEEKAAKEAEKEAKIAATASKARKKALDLLAGKQYKGVETLDTINRYSIKAENGMPVLPKEPTARPKVNRSNINFSGDRVDIWQGQPELAKHTGGFKVKREKGYKYSVDVDGKEVLLNRNETMITFEGERVHGVPSIHSRLREIDNDNLVARLAESMQHVENHVDRSIKAPAIDWSETYHGKVDKNLLKLSGEEGKYGGAEIHHIDQWSKVSFKSVTDRLDNADISVEQAKDEMKGLLVFMNDKTKAGGSVYADMWRIDPAKLGDRDLVILPAGAHNFTSTTLYPYLHPEGIHPETGKRAEFGIPVTGDSGESTLMAGISGSGLSSTVEKPTLCVKR